MFTTKANRACLAQTVDSQDCYSTLLREGFVIVYIIVDRSRKEEEVEEYLVGELKLE